jgi:hypothetical protein
VGKSQIGETITSQGFSEFWSGLDCIFKIELSGFSVAGFALDSGSVAFKLAGWLDVEAVHACFEVWGQACSLSNASSDGAMPDFFVDVTEVLGSDRDARLFLKQGVVDNTLDKLVLVGVPRRLHAVLPLVDMSGKQPLLQFLESPHAACKSLGKTKDPSSLPLVSRRLHEDFRKSLEDNPDWVVQRCVNGQSISMISPPHWSYELVEHGNSSHFGLIWENTLLVVGVGPLSVESLQRFFTLLRDVFVELGEEPMDVIMDSRLNTGSSMQLKALSM